jgi:hypothetical protein
MATKMVNGRPARLGRAGFLLGPLGWLNERLLDRITPELLSLLFELEPKSMHLLGLAIAHGAGDPLLGLFPKAPKAVVEQVIGYWPEGLDRLTEVLPSVALSLEHYQVIPHLLSDSPIAKFLQHRRTIDDLTIAGLSALPSALRRPAVLKLFDRCERMDRFVHGLRFLGERARLSFDDLVNELGRLDQTEQVVAKIAEIVESLPLPDALSPPSVGSFDRIDRVSEIRRLAKSWHNCLADYLFNINQGTSAVYLSNNGGRPAVAFVSRSDRMGWLLNQIKGPHNSDIDQNCLVEHQTAFLKAGIPDYIDIAAIRYLILQTRWPRVGN